MTRTIHLSLYLLLAALAGLTFASRQAGAEGLEFGKTAAHISDVQFRHSLSPDRKAVTILFDNLHATVVPAAAPLASRTFSLSYPMAGGTAADKLAVRIDGALSKDAGMAVALIVRILGETHQYDFADMAEPGNFTKELLLPSEGAKDLRLTLVLLAESLDASKRGEASITIDNVDIGLPLPPEKP